MLINRHLSARSRTANGESYIRLDERFIRALHEDYRLNGMEAVLWLRTNQAWNYLRLVLALRREEIDSNEPQSAALAEGEPVCESTKEANAAPFRFLSRRLRMQALEQELATGAAELAALTAEEESLRREAEAKLPKPPAGANS